MDEEGNQEDRRFGMHYLVGYYWYNMIIGYSERTVLIYFIRQTPTSILILSINYPNNINTPSNIHHLVFLVSNIHPYFCTWPIIISINICTYIYIYNSWVAHQMSLFIIGSVSRITSSIIHHISKNSQFKSVTVADLLPSYDYHHRFYRLQK